MLLTQDVKIGLWQTKSIRLSVSSWLWEPSKGKKKKVEIWGNLRTWQWELAFLKVGLVLIFCLPWDKYQSWGVQMSISFCCWKHKNNSWTCLRPSLLLMVCWNTYWWVKSLHMKYFISRTNLIFPFPIWMCMSGIYWSKILLREMKCQGKTEKHHIELNEFFSDWCILGRIFSYRINHNHSSWQFEWCCVRHCKRPVWGKKSANMQVFSFLSRKHIQVSQMPKFE